MRLWSTTAAALAAALLWTVSGAGAATVYNFDDATFQGWTTISGGAHAQAYAVTNNSYPGPQAGTHYVRSMDFNNRDAAHTTLWVRSPEFVINEPGNLTMWLMGGRGDITLPANAASVPANSLASGAMGVALRDVSTGDFLLKGRRTYDSQTVWEQITFTQAQLAAVNTPGRVFTLDLIDYNHTSWAWLALDTVSIPGGAPSVIPEPAAASLLGLATLAFARRR